MLMKYVGPDSGTQLIAATGQRAEPGEVIEVPDEIASLLPGVWQSVKKTAAKPPTEE